MPKPTGPTSDKTRKLIAEFRKHKDALSEDIANKLERPMRSKKAVNLQKISKAGAADVVVPGKVLGIGQLKKPVNIYALSFSKSAREKISKASGKAYPLNEVKGKKAKMVV